MHENQIEYQQRLNATIFNKWLAYGLWAIKKKSCKKVVFSPMQKIAERKKKVLILLRMSL